MDTQRSPKKEEEEEVDHQPSLTFESIKAPIDDFDSIFDITIGNLSCSHQLTWDFWEEEEENCDEDVGEDRRLNTDQEGSSLGFCENMSTDYEDKDLGLKLNLNHQEVIDAWSDKQQPLWTDTSTPANSFYRGEVPVIEGEKNMRREASVLRYKEKRQSRLFSKKIRYQVRKLNADKRPRFKVSQAQWAQTSPLRASRRRQE